MRFLLSTHSAADRRPNSGCLVAVLIFVALSALMLWRTSRSGEGRPLAALELTPLTGDGEPVTLESLKGKVVLVNFFATWCGPCRAELPHLADLRRDLASNPDFVLLAVSAGDENPDRLLSDTKEFLETLRLDVPTYADPARVTRDAFAQVESSQGFPTSFVLDRNGVIRRIWIGYMPGLEDEMRETVEQLLQL